MYAIEKFTFGELPKHGVIYEMAHDVEPKEVKQKIFDFEKALAKTPDARFGDDLCPLEHTFVDGAYIRKITMEEGLVLTSKEHGKEHPFFILEGECTVVTDKATQRIKAPHWGITKPGTKRAIYIHKKTVWVTVHPTDKKDLADIEQEIIIKGDNLLEVDI